MRVILYLMFALACAMGVSAADVVRLGAFSAGALDGWTEKRFAGSTEYSLAEDEGRRVLRAVSHMSASALYKHRRIDLAETPYLRWSWKVENTLGQLEETRKAGDDYPARVYVIVSSGLFAWRTHAVNYVWASNQPQGATWPNAYTANAGMIALRSGDAQIGRWLSEQRNVREDFRRVHGLDVRWLDAVALMTDTDNTGKTAVAYYGDIYFSSE